MLLKRREEPFVLPVPDPNNALGVAGRDVPAVWAEGRRTHWTGVPGEQRLLPPLSGTAVKIPYTRGPVGAGCDEIATVFREGRAEDAPAIARERAQNLPVPRVPNAHEVVAAGGDDQLSGGAPGDPGCGHEGMGRAVTIAPVEMEIPDPAASLGVEDLAVAVDVGGYGPRPRGIEVDSHHGVVGSVLAAGAAVVRVADEDGAGIGREGHEIFRAAELDCVDRVPTE